MLLCGTRDLRAGMTVGVPVRRTGPYPGEFIGAGTVLDDGLIAEMKNSGIDEAWVIHPATVDLDDAPLAALTARLHKVTRRLHQQFAEPLIAQMTAAQALEIRTDIVSLVCDIVAQRRFIRPMAPSMDPQFAVYEHGLNVAMLSIFIGVELEAYIVRERPRLSPSEARDMVSLAFGAVFHDAGKVSLSDEAQAHHGIYEALRGRTRPVDYEQHAPLGYEFLKDTGIAASARQMTLNHHQRFDGAGWPNMAPLANGRPRGPQRAHDIHVFSRIVTVADALDALMIDDEGNARPAVAAMRDLADPRVDGWFDPVVREVALRRLPVFPIGALLQTSDGRFGVVVRRNSLQPCRPAIRMIELDCRNWETHPAVDQCEVVDLAYRHDLHVVRCAGSEVESFLFELPQPKTRGPEGAAGGGTPGKRATLAGSA